jgi:uncharacterized sulfatase
VTARWLLGMVAGLWLTPAFAFDYHLTATAIAPDTYAVLGTTEHFNRGNGGNIVNTGFILTGEGVVVIDTGPSLDYGRQLRALIARTTDQPLHLVLITHQHPDHFLGNGAFADVPVAALAQTRAQIEAMPPAILDGLYRLVGDAMAGTASVPPTVTVAGGIQRIGGHELHLAAVGGHTAADLAVFDRTTGVLFAGDIAFLDRTPTTPQADIGEWLAAITTLRALGAATIVPGHGPVARDTRPFDQTAAYLTWLRDTLGRAAAQGLDAAEVQALPLPPQFAGLAVAREEFARSVAHLYPAFERAALDGNP